MQDTPELNKTGCKSENILTTLNVRQSGVYNPCRLDKVLLFCAAFQTAFFHYLFIAYCMTGTKVK